MGMHTNSPHVRKKVCHHKTMFGMDCDEYDRLLERAECSCELCGRIDWLGVDHDHSNGPFAARGILCPKCNAHMRLVDCGHYEPSEAVAAYLASSWHLQEEAAAARVSEWVATNPPINWSDYNPLDRTYSASTSSTAKCGTRSGYQRHRREGSATCRDCRDAMNAYFREWKSRRTPVSSSAPSQSR